ncbi:hypothetical protein HDU97_009417 [Phlyctochytrium planicorne]|nr:hypothetical protein HDU97_009417 [Phlyctochytrium planicorne]
MFNLCASGGLCRTPQETLHASHVSSSSSSMVNFREALSPSIASASDASSTAQPPLDSNGVIVVVTMAALVVLVACISVLVVVYYMRFREDGSVNPMGKMDEEGGGLGRDGLSVRVVGERVNVLGGETMESIGSEVTTTSMASTTTALIDRNNPPATTDSLPRYASIFNDIQRQRYSSSSNPSYIASSSERQQQQQSQQNQQQQLQRQRHQLQRQLSIVSPNTDDEDDEEEAESHDRGPPVLTITTPFNFSMEAEYDLLDEPLEDVLETENSVRNWSVEMVCQALRLSEMEDDDVEKFRKKRIDGPAFLALDDAKLWELGLSSLTARKFVMSMVQDMQKG